MLSFAYIKKGGENYMAVKTEKRTESLKKVEVKAEELKIAETLGKFLGMRAKSGIGDKSGIYGHG